MTDPAIDPAPAVDDVPPAPSRNDPPDVFVDKSDATLAAWPQLVQQINAIAVWMESAGATVYGRAGEAAESATASANSAASASNTLTEVVALAGLYGKRHQGSHSAPPTTRNDGSPLQVGDLYYDPVADKTFRWNGV